jgi:hypothetical protein
VQYEELDIPPTGPRAAGPASWRQRAHRQSDGTARRMVIVAGGIGAAMVLALAVISLTGHNSGQVPVVQADPRPLRVKPANPGGLQIANDDVFANSGDGQSAELAAPPETPNPAALKAQMKAETLPAPPAPEPRAVAPAAPPPGVATRTLPALAPAATQPTALAAKPAPAASPATHDTAPATGHTQIQLAAVPTEDAARLEWKRLAARMPDLLSGRTPDITRTDHDGHVFWRIRLGLPDVADASSFCDKVRAKGGGCAIATF